MNKLIIKSLEELSSSVYEGTVFISEDEDVQFEKNKNEKFKLLNFILDNFSKKESGISTSSDFKEILNKSIEILQSNTGCAEDLEILDMIFDILIEKGIVTESEYEDVVANSSSGRWL